MSHQVLVVDDDPVIRTLLQDYLAIQGFEVQAVESGIKCLEHLGNTKPDVILLDYQMPVMNGEEVLRTIRSESRLRDLRVIMLSAQKNLESLTAAHSGRADRYITKPFEMEVISEAIRELAAGGGILERVE